MVKMQIAGIQIEVPEGEVSLYKRAGYSVVVEEPAPVEEPAKIQDAEEPAKKKASKKE